MQRLRAGAASAIGANLPLAGLLARVLPQGGPDGLEPKVYGFILRYSWREQIYVVVMTALSFPFLYYSLDLPRIIINRAISGKNFPQNFFGLELGQIPYLLMLCGVFLALILINGWFKLHVNVKKGQLGERMLRRLRYELYERLLRFPLHHFDRHRDRPDRRHGDGRARAGWRVCRRGVCRADFAGRHPVHDPLFHVHPKPGTRRAAALAFYPLQGYLIPKMQRVIRALGRSRIRKIRDLSDRIGEAIAARIEIRINAAPHISSQRSPIASARSMTSG